jgi:hypothetical protein
MAEHPIRSISRSPDEAMVSQRSEPLLENIFPRQFCSRWATIRISCCWAEGTGGAGWAGWA